MACCGHDAGPYITAQAVAAAWSASWSPLTRRVTLRTMINKWRHQLFLTMFVPSAVCEHARARGQRPTPRLYAVSEPIWKSVNDTLRSSFTFLQTAPYTLLASWVIVEQSLYGWLQNLIKLPCLWNAFWFNQSFSCQRFFWLPQTFITWPILPHLKQQKSIKILIVE